MAASTTTSTSKAITCIFMIIFFTILLQLFIITTPTFASSEDVPNVVVGPGRPLDPVNPPERPCIPYKSCPRGRPLVRNRPVCNGPRGLPCKGPVNPQPGRRCKYYNKCPPARNTTGAARPNIEKNN